MPRPRFGSRGGAGRWRSRGCCSLWRSQQRSYYRRDRVSPERTEREAETQDARARGMDVDRSQPRKGPGRERWRVKPDSTGPERSPSPAPGDTVPHPVEAGTLWVQLMARGNLADALRRVEQNAGAPGIDGMSTKELRPWLKDHWPEIRSALDAGIYRPQPVRRPMFGQPWFVQRAVERTAHAKPDVGWAPYGVRCSIPLRLPCSATSWERGYCDDHVRAGSLGFFQCGIVGRLSSFSECGWIASMPWPVRTYRPVPLTFWIRPSRVKRSNVFGSMGWPRCRSGSNILGAPRPISALSSSRVP
jgi:hypothetical protein